MNKTLHPEMANVLRVLDESGVSNISRLSLSEARQKVDSVLATDQDESESVGSVENISVPAGDHDVDVRIYTPESEPPYPLLLFFHGGGWVLGDVDSVDAECRALTNAAQCGTISVDYSLAPESPFPVAVRECYELIRYISENAREFGGLPTDLAVGGSSAGGNLSAVLAQLCRDRDGPEISHQLLIYPVTDFSFDTPSYSENAEGYFLTRSDMRWFWNHYLVDNIHGKNPYTSPLQARSFASLPPATVITAGFDPLRDEGIAYARRLKNADVSVDHYHYEGAIHGFFGMLTEPAVPQARDAVDSAASDLRRSFQQ